MLVKQRITSQLKVAHNIDVIINSDMLKLAFARNQQWRVINLSLPGLSV